MNQRPATAASQLGGGRHLGGDLGFQLNQVQIGLVILRTASARHGDVAGAQAVQRPDRLGQAVAAAAKALGAVVEAASKFPGQVVDFQAWKKRSGSRLSPTS